ncbi:MAG: 3-hydroxyacyl-ACP dehydratase FabZ [Burkholderiaceae bacterium]|jgi:3-hydroxyacyl-[acyl-carrier-protein] dehydratase|nr:3-hydroxyacyl-ACP dehydratase FabZ [Burkholderiaceae bacterium]MBR2960200.1 3-hydroxyacyl-ACP dehydratase FabZ [Burkholderiaceae bacterium]
MKYDINDIMKILPHRYPFLLIDRVESINEDKTVCVAIKNVTANEPQFTGHFPSVPVMPGVLIIEAMAQCGAILALDRLAPEEKQEDVLFFFAGIDNARFKRVVVPGDQLRIEATYLRDRGGIGKFDVVATVDGQVACSATLMCARRAV